MTDSKATNWHIFQQTIRDARDAFSDIPRDELQTIIDEAVEDVRAKLYFERAQRS